MDVIETGLAPQTGRDMTVSHGHGFHRVDDWTWQMSENAERLTYVEEVRMATRDGVLLAANVYRLPSGRVPTVLVRTPYSRHDLRDRVTEIDPLLVVRE